MRLTVNYTILDILHNEQMITAEKVRILIYTNV